MKKNFAGSASKNLQSTSPWFRSCAILCSLVALSLAAAPRASAQTLITGDAATPDSSFSSTYRTYEQNGDLGFLFQVGSSNLGVTSLGQFVPSTGLAVTDTVYLYKVTGSMSGGTFTPTSDTLITSATITAGSTPDADGFTYSSLTVPAILTSGSEYVIDYDDSADNPFRDSLTATSSSIGNEFDTTYITPLAATLTAGDSGPSTPTFPNTISNGYGIYVGPNAKFEVLPEPSTFALVGLGALALVIMVRCKGGQALE